MLIGYARVVRVFGRAKLSVMESLRSYWEAQAREDEEYEKALSEKCRS